MDDVSIIIAICFSSFLCYQLYELLKENKESEYIEE
jgi:hypothetical protein